VERDPELGYQRELIADSARYTERFELLSALAVGPDPVPTILVGPLIRLLDSGDDPSRAQAARALGRSGALEALPALIRSLRAPAAAVAAAAAEALGVMGDPTAAESLRPLLEDRRNAPRRAAIVALGLLGDPSMPGQAPRDVDAVVFARYLERVGLLERQELLLEHIEVPGRAGAPAGALPVEMFREEVLPGLLVDLEHHDDPCSIWRDGRSTCRCLADDGSRARLRLGERGGRVRIVGIELSERRVRGAPGRPSGRTARRTPLENPVERIARSDFRKRAIVYVTSSCPACRYLLSWMRRWKVDHQVRNIDTDWAAKREFDGFGGGGVPLVVIGDKYHRGFCRSWILRQLRNP